MKRADFNSILLRVENDRDYLDNAGYALLAMTDRQLKSGIVLKISEVQK